MAALLKQQSSDPLTFIKLAKLRRTQNIAHKTEKRDSPGLLSPTHIKRNNLAQQKEERKKSLMSRISLALQNGPLND